MAALRRRTLLKLGAAAALALVVPHGARTRRADVAQAPHAAAQPQPAALRFDWRHALDAGVERFALERLRAEPLWSGARPGLEPLGWGDYRFSMRDADSGALLATEGFDSTLDRARANAGVLLSVRAPVPSRRVHVTIERRRTEKVFQDVWSDTIDPARDAIDRSPPAIVARLETLVSNGGPQGKVNLGILGDGYREGEAAKFTADARRAAGYLFSVEPFRSRMRDFNVHALFAASAQSGVTDGYLGLQRDTVLRCAYYAGGSERALAAGDGLAVREIAAAAPCDFLLILANARRYGGSAYFGGPAVAAIDSGAARYLVIHELAHVIGGLADEYYIPTAYGPTRFSNIEPWQPNVTIDPARRRWHALGAEDRRTHAWNKVEYDRYFEDYVRRYRRLRAARAEEPEVEDFMRAEAAQQRRLLAPHAAARAPGYYEGANGYARGAYRCEPDCIMFSLQTEYFCAACTAALGQMIDRHCA